MDELFLHSLLLVQLPWFNQTEKSERESCNYSITSPNNASLSLNSHSRLDHSPAPTPGLPLWRQTMESPGPQVTAALQGAEGNPLGHVLTVT